MIKPAFLILIFFALGYGAHAQLVYGPVAKSWQNLQKLGFQTDNLLNQTIQEISDGNSFPDRGEKHLKLTIPQGAIIKSARSNQWPTNPPNVLNESPQPIRTFQGLDDGNVRGISTIPPDTHGAVGDDQIISVTNSEVRIQNKQTGATIGNIVRLSTFFNSINFGGSAPSCFDPRALYDAVHRRFIIVAAVNGGNVSNSGFVIAVSAQGTATGTWNFYGIVGDASKITWFDFPYVGLNKDLLVVTGNMFTATNQFSNAKVWAFNKFALYDGAPINYFTNAQEFFLPAGDGSSLCPTMDYDATIDRVYLLQTFNGNINNSGFLRLSCLKGRPPGATIELISLVQHPTIAWAASAGNGLAKQLNDDRGIDAGNHRIGNALLINGNLWCTHTVFLPASNPSFCGPAWYQMDTTGSIIQNGTLTTGGIFRYYPTIAVNRAENVLLGYTISDETRYATSAYAFRTASDNFGALRSEFSFQAGKDSYFKTFSGSINRWGDYSNTIVDPSDQSLWTVQQFAEENNTGVSRWSTQWAQVAPTGNLGPLPVTLLQWDAKLQSGPSIGLRWKVSLEQGLSHYEIMRSKNGISFEAIGKVQAKGLATNQTYSWVDKSPLLGRSFYRLRMVDKDGSFSASDVRSLMIEAGFTMLGLGENPVKDGLLVRFYAPKPNTVELIITNSIGQNLVRKKNAVQEGYYQERIAVSHLAPGTYYLVVLTENGQRIALPFVKQ